jgi:hypothetical protein
LGNRWNEGAAVGAAANGETAAIGPDLQTVIDAWPTLPEETRAAILAAVEAEGAGPKAAGPFQPSSLPEGKANTQTPQLTDIMTSKPGKKGNLR